jgi:DNA-binding response OmpR family regulator
MDEKTTNSGRGRVFIVEDEPVIGEFIVNALSSQDFSVTAVADGRSAWQLLSESSDNFDAILLDRGLPWVDGMELLRRIKSSSNLSRVPVVMQTAVGRTEDISEGIAAGAYYYLVKPVQFELLVAVVTAAVNHHREYREMQDALRRSERTLVHLDQGSFRIKTIADSIEVSRAIGQMCADPAKAALGLRELFTNGIEHGNLGVTYAEKAALVMENRWFDEIERRLELESNRDKFVSVTVSRQDSLIQVLIQDQGAGFDWQKYLEIDPDRIFDPHGRGIAMSRMMSFESMEYLGNGNTVRLTLLALPQST